MNRALLLSPAYVALAAAGCGGGHHLGPPILQEAPLAIHNETAASLDTAAPTPPGRRVPTNTATLSADPRPATSSTPDRELNDALNRINDLLDAYFDFNAYRLRPDAVETVTQAAALLKKLLLADPSIHLVIEGHCDERGSAEFNLALGDRRAESVRELLQQLGVPAARITTFSYGENRPACEESTEACWQKNRRAHIRRQTGPMS